MNVIVFPSHFPSVNFTNKSATSANDEAKNIVFTTVSLQSSRLSPHKPNIYIVAPEAAFAKPHISRQMASKIPPCPYTGNPGRETAETQRLAYLAHSPL